MAKKAKADPDDGLVAPGESGKLEVEKRTDEKIGRTLARITLDPQTRNANLAMSFGSQMFGDQLKPDIAESSAVLAEEIQRAMKGDLSLASRIFTSQAISLDALFTDMARRSGAQLLTATATLVDGEPLPVIPERPMHSWAKLPERQQGVKPPAGV